jgi:hypothetical protein
MAGYTSSFFYTDKTDGSMVFKVPSNGGTTSGSSYPRVEFRQMSNGANWALIDTTEHYLTAECKVITVATAKPQIIIGQIHGSDAISELLKLRWNGYLAGQCSVEARFKTNDSAKTEYGVILASGLSLGNTIDYTITMKNGKIIIIVNGVSGSQTYTTAYFGSTDQYYFKAGDYLQYNSTDSSIYGQTQFYKLSLSSPTLIVDKQPLHLEKCELNQNYPNPFNPATVISYQLSVISKVNLKVYDIIGKEVATLVNEVQQAGVYTVNFNAGNLSSGIYFYKLWVSTPTGTAGSFVQTKKMILLK